MSKYLDTTGLSKLIALIKNWAAPVDHEHSASDISSGAVGIANGGTGATSKLGANNGIASWSLDTGTTIAGGTNLDTMKTVGNYVCGLDSTASTLTNCPTNGSAFMMKVGELLCDANKGYLYQYVVRHADGASWRRTFAKSSGTWNEWHSDSMARFDTTIWTGTWNAGSITADLKDYQMFAIETSGTTDNYMLGVRIGNKVHCHSVHCATTNILTLNTVTFSVSGTTLTRTLPRTWTITGTSVSSANGATVITAIRGLL